MSHATFPQTNGATAHSPQAWLNQTVQQFFGAINWADHPPEMEDLRLVAQPEETQPLHLLTVGQFFGAMNWEGRAVASSPSFAMERVADSEGDDALTLDVFSDLF
jgi:hypothetical protein